MTAIDELLTLLKERGFEHYRHEVPAEEDCVAFYDGNRWHDCWESVDGEVNVTFSMTPEQAIAATLGPCSDSCNCTNGERTGERTDLDATVERETCHMETADGCQNWNSCSECGADYYTDQPINYCPNCGRKMVAQ